jgi:hypothetical protein
MTCPDRKIALDERPLKLPNNFLDRWEWLGNNSPNIFRLCERSLTVQTTRQLERLWNARQFDRLVRELLAGRVESSHRLIAELSRNLPAAALALIRMDELNQSHHPLAQKLIHLIISQQESDGGWGDPLITALCIRALLASRGEGMSIERGLTYLADLQKSEGAWPAVPIRRTAEDAFVSAFILFQLADQPAFRAAVRFDHAINWFVTHEPSLDEDARKLWNRVALRCNVNSMMKPARLHISIEADADLLQPALAHN